MKAPSKPRRPGTQGEQLHYYEVLTALSQRAGQLEAAATFCAAAVEAAQQALQPADSLYSTCLGRLWTQLFGFALEGERYQVRGPDRVAVVRLEIAYITKNLKY